nr:hypothetical protein Itr_chr10CG03860 [Ipomoea trifida]
MLIHAQEVRDTIEIHNLPPIIIYLHAPNSNRGYNNGQSSTPIAYHLSNKKLFFKLLLPYTVHFIIHHLILNCVCFILKFFSSNFSSYPLCVLFYKYINNLT